MAPTARADESRAGRAAAQRARREACVRIERGAEGGDDPPPWMSHEAPGDSGCVTSRQRRVQRAVCAGVDASDLEDAEHVTDAVRGVDEAPGPDRELPGKPWVAAQSRAGVRPPCCLERVATVDGAGDLVLLA